MPQLMRGAKATSPERIAAAMPHKVERARHPRNSSRYQRGHCRCGATTYSVTVCTAEEFFAKACDGIDMGYHKAVTWARNHWSLNGAGLWEIMTLMQTQGIYNGDSLYLDGPFRYVDFTDGPVLQNAIFQGPVKIGVAADQIENVIQKYGIAKNGWVMTGFSPDTNLDHCTGLCGYGTMAWLATQVGAVLPKKMNGNTPGYAMFTWSSIGLIDVPSLIAITGESWLRTPTTIVKPNPVPATTRRP